MVHTIKVNIPRQQKTAERLEKYVAFSPLSTVEQGIEVHLSRSSILKLITVNCVYLNGVIVKEKNINVRGGDEIIIKLTNIDAFLKKKASNQAVSLQSIKTISTTKGKDNKKNKNDDDSDSDQEGVKENKKLCTLVGTNLPLDILYEDKWLTIINKPAGMLVHPPPVSTTHQSTDQLNQTHTLVNALIHKYGVEGLSSIGGEDRPGIVHRLDKDTAGILIIAKDDDIHEQIKELLKAHTFSMIESNGTLTNNVTKGVIKKQQTIVTKKQIQEQKEKEQKLQQGPTIQKKYCCLVSGKPKQSHGFINKPIARHPNDRNKMVIDEVKGKESITEYKVLKVWNGIQLKVLKEKKSNNSDYKFKKRMDEYDQIISHKSNDKKSIQSSDDDDDEEDDDSDEEEKEEESSDEEDSDEDAILDDEDDDSEEEEDSEDDSDEEEEEEEEESSDEDDIVTLTRKLQIQQKQSQKLNQKKLKSKKIPPKSYSLLEITLHTGRTHQIRVHMASEGMPIVGDPIYSGKSSQFLVPFVLLASVQLEFTHPMMNNERKQFKIPYPSHIQSFIERLDQEELILNNQNNQYNTNTTYNNNAVKITTPQQPQQQKNNNKQNNIINNNNNSKISNNNNNSKNNKKGGKQVLSKEEQLERDFFFK